MSLYNYLFVEHFNVQQLLSSTSHFVLFSQAHLKITLKTKSFEKGGPNNSGGIGFFFKKNKRRGPFIWDLRVFSNSNFECITFD